MEYETIITRLLEVELNNFASRLNLINAEPITLSVGETIEAISFLDKISKEDNDYNRQIAILIIAIISAYGQYELKEMVRQIVTPILSKIGFSPSTSLIDSSFKKSQIYSSNISYYDKLSITANDQLNQVVIGTEEFILTKFQTELWKLIDKSKLIGVSAPTSAGKSFLIYLKIIDLILNGYSKIVYIVPTLSLIGQVTSDISKLLKRFGIKGLSVLNSFEKGNNKFIYIVTQERALSIFSEEGIDEIDMLVVEEVQNIERVANEGADRSNILYDVLKDIKNNYAVKKIILSGPRLKNIANMGTDIFRHSSEELKSEAPPVLSITYSISKNKGRYYINQYSPIFESTMKLSIENSCNIYGLGGSLYNDKFNKYLHSILESLDDSINIIFSPTPNQARKSAEEYYKYSKGKNTISDRLNDLPKYVSQSVHPCYDLAKYLASGMAYHTGKTPSHVRKCLEIASSEGLIQNIFCTTTLMQGVNLPANNIIIRNPNLFIKRRNESVQLSAYEFANLRGRAGRLLVDFIGRSIVLDEGSFVDNEEPQNQQKLFKDEYKEIRVGYKDIYNRNHDFIDSALEDKTQIADADSKYLLTYIRYTLLKYSKNGIERLKDVGIDIDKTLIYKAISDLNNLDVPVELCLKNRYWDPLDLNQLYYLCKNSSQSLPSTVWATRLDETIKYWLTFMSKKFPYYFQRYIPSSNEKYLYSISKLTESWSREVSLYEILTHRFGYEWYKDIHEDIDNEIDKISRAVSFGLPMLLKPISDIYQENNSFISSIEYGAHSPNAKYLIDRGVPRETAIKISKKIAVENEDQIVCRIRELNNYLHHWEWKQIDHLMV